MYLKFEEIESVLENFVCCYDFWCDIRVGDLYSCVNILGFVCWVWVIGLILCLEFCLVILIIFWCLLYF